MIRINLLPVRAVQKQEQLRGQLVVLALCLILTGVGCGGFYMSVSIKIDDQKAAIGQKQARIAQLHKAIGEVGKFKKLQKELRGKLEVLESLKKNRNGPVRLLDELNRALPPKLWLTHFGQAGKNIDIKGIGMDEATVAEFMRSLEQSPYYKNIQLRVTERVGRKGLKLQKFALSALSATPKN
ncbi:hypothetical protein B5V00_11135 [Geothermobacter hydrogeniphilus]|uniref:Type IV pilus assembly protein PilN n=2 Tax=Geothermobacter hydrogeniphilus TaxID=1969733 RepID=A0A1X0Y1P3_9BACT|nr:hypothetical protein B5V00_11135 [Geothermobacter hydrogeniphilus]